MDIDQKMIDYIFSHTSELHPVQKKIIKFNEKLGYIKKLQISVLQANFIEFLIKFKKFKSCLEIGTFTGYSALVVALALPSDGQVIACDVNEETTQIAQQFWEKAGVAHKIDLRLAPALETLEQLIAEGQNNTFDFAFIDADKSNYNEYYEIIITMMRSGGIICIDNTLWKGRVYDLDNSKSTQSIRDLNLRIKKDKRVEHSLLTIYDGMTMCYVK